MKTLSEDHKRKIAAAHIGMKHSAEARAKISAAQKGRHHSIETRRRQSESLKQAWKENPWTLESLTKAQAIAHTLMKAGALAGERNGNWKGDAVGYNALHTWVRKTLGRPSLCNRCGTTEAKRYEWANISREYKRDPSDWERLCVSCHRKDGFKRGEYKSCAKGLHIQFNTGRTHIKKGQHLSPTTEFKSAYQGVR